MASPKEKGGQAWPVSRGVTELNVARILAWLGVLQYRYPALGTALGLSVIWLALTFVSPHFLTARNITNIFLQSATIGILAMGTTVVLISGEIDLAIGSLEGLTGAIAAVLIISWGLPFWLGLPLAIAVGGLANLVTGFFTTKFDMPSFISSLGMMGIAHGFALILTNGSPIFNFPDQFRVLGRGSIGWLPVPVLIAFGILILLYLFMHQTKLGVEIYAVGGDKVAAARVGINVNLIKQIALIIGGLTAGLAGVMLSARLNAGNANFGQGDLLDAIAAVVIGGTSLNGGRGTIVGSALGVLVIVSIRNGLNLLGITSFWQQVAIGSIILGAVLIDRLAARQVS